MRNKIFLALLLIFAFAATSYADNVNLVQIGDTYTTVGDNYITLTSGDGDSIISALKVMRSGGVLTLSGDFDVARTIEINKPVKIRSANGKVSLNAQSTLKKGVIKISANNVELENLSISGGINSEFGGGVFLKAGTLTLTNCEIKNNTAISGGGIYANKNTTLNMQGCEISGNTTALGGGGVYLNSATANLTDCKITNNRENTSWGGGIMLMGSSQLTLTDCEISENYSNYYGGGLYITQSGANKAVKITGCKISGNTGAHRGGGLYYYNDGTEAMEITDCEILGNKTTYSRGGGGGVYASKGEVEISGGSVKNNVSAWNGGGLFVEKNSVVNVMGCEISGNTAANSDNDVHNEGTYNNNDLLANAEFSGENVNASSSSGGCNSFGLGLALCAVIFFRKGKNF